MEWRISAKQPNWPIAGVFGLGWNAHSLATQIESKVLTNGRFSYCLVDHGQLEHGKATYLKFGSDIEPLPILHKIKLLKHGDWYPVNTQGIGMNGKQLITFNQKVSVL